MRFCSSSLNDWLLTREIFSLEDLVHVSESLENNSVRLSMISEEGKSLRTQSSCPPLFFAELQNKTENMRKIQSLEWPKWRYDTTGY